jgi:hypothetical protein
MFEDSILEVAGKGKKATTVVVSTIVHFALLGILIVIPLIFTEQLEAGQVPDCADGAPSASPASSTSPICCIRSSARSGEGSPG